MLSTSPQPIDKKRNAPGVVEKLGTGGALLAALACPVCFPKLALIGAALGFGVLAPFEGSTAFAVQGLFVVAWIGQVIAFRRHRNRWLLSFSTVVTLLLFGGFYVSPSTIMLQSALAGLAFASVWLIIAMRQPLAARQASGNAMPGSQ